MKFWKLWKEVEEKNQMVKTGKVSMTSDNFKKALKYAYDKGKTENTCISDQFNEIFGGAK